MFTCSCFDIGVSIACSVLDLSQARTPYSSLSVKMQKNNTINCVSIESPFQMADQIKFSVKAIRHCSVRMNKAIKVFISDVSPTPPSGKLFVQDRYGHTIIVIAKLWSVVLKSIKLISPYTYMAWMTASSGQRAALFMSNFH